MNGPRERLAWLILLGSLSICIGLAIAIPITASAILQRATRSLTVNVQANQGTVGILQSDGVTGALFAGEPAQNLDPGGVILTNSTDQALVLLQLPDDEQILARISVYGNSNVNLERATTPRFATSSASNNLDMTLSSGRLHLSVPKVDGRSLSLRLAVPQGQISIQEPGQYSVLTSNTETQLAVLQGAASLSDGVDELTLLTDQRGLLPTDQPPSGPLDTERNLIKNGDFGQGIGGWVPLAPNVELAGQAPAEAGVIVDADEPTLVFTRVGLGHADAGLRQIINQDVADYESLTLVVSMRIAEQSLGVCGQQGSECPLIIRIEYVDANGVDQTWQQGFYAVGNIGPDTPDVCVACPPPLNEHQRVPFQQIVFHESENLIEKLGQLNILPQQIKSITLIASGHTFSTEVLEVALVAKE